MSKFDQRPPEALMGPPGGGGGPPGPPSLMSVNPGTQIFSDILVYVILLSIRTTRGILTNNTFENGNMMNSSSMGMNICMTCRRTRWLRWTRS